MEVEEKGADEGGVGGKTAIW